MCGGEVVCGVGWGGGKGGRGEARPGGGTWGGVVCACGEGEVRQGLEGVCRGGQSWDEGLGV